MDDLRSKRTCIYLAYVAGWVNRFGTRVLSSAKTRTVREKNREESSWSQARSRQLRRVAFIMNELPRYFDRIVEDSERFTFTTSSLNDRLSAVAKKKNGLVGKPTLQVREKQLYIGLSGTARKFAQRMPVLVGLISEELLESPRELFAVERHEFVLPELVWERVSVVFDELVRKIPEVAPNASKLLLKVSLKEQGLRIKIRNILKSASGAHRHKMPEINETSIRTPKLFSSMSPAEGSSLFLKVI